VARTKHLVGWPLFAVVVVGTTFTALRAQEEANKPKPKHEIKDVMKGVHVAPKLEKSLRDKVLEGNASAEDKQKLLDLYISLAENDPPKGESDAWQKKTRDVILAAAKIVVGRDGAVEELRVATNCAACHKDHKPPQE